MPRLRIYLERENKNIGAFWLDVSPLDTDAALIGGCILVQEDLFNAPHLITETNTS
jgi:hypothetical protein